MTFGASSRVIATAFGLAAFAVAVIAGLAAGNSPVRTLAVAIASMVVCRFVGLVLGAAGEAAVREHLAAARAANSSHQNGQEGAPGATSENPQVVHNG